MHREMSHRLNGEVDDAIDDGGAGGVDVRAFRCVVMTVARMIDAVALHRWMDHRGMAADCVT